MKDFLLQQLLRVSAPLIVGILSHAITNALDQVKRVTAGWSVTQKNALATAVAALLSILGAWAGQTFVAPDTPSADVLNHIDVNTMAGAAVAILLKHSTQIRTLMGHGPGAQP